MNPEMESLPACYVDSVFTRTSFLCIAAKSLELRRQICARLNSLELSITFKDILYFEKALENCFDGIPVWDDSTSNLAHVLLAVQLKQLIVMLHAPTVLSHMPSSE